MNDPTLSFMTTIKAFMKSHSTSPDPTSHATDPTSHATDPTSHATDKDTEKKGKICIVICLTTFLYKQYMKLPISKMLKTKTVCLAIKITHFMSHTAVFPY